MFRINNKSHSYLLLLLLALSAAVFVSSFTPQADHAAAARAQFSKGYISLLESTSFATIGNRTTQKAPDKSPIASLKEMLSKLSGSSSSADATTTASNRPFAADSEESARLPHVVLVNETSAVLGEENEGEQETDSTGIPRALLEQMRLHKEEATPSAAPTSLPVDDSIDAHVIVGKVSDMFLQGVGGDIKPKKRSGSPVSHFPMPVDDSIDAHVIEGKVSDMYLQGVGGANKKKKKSSFPSSPVELPVDDSIDAHVIKGKVSDMYLQGVEGVSKKPKKKQPAPSPPVEARVDNFAGEFASMSPTTKSRETYPAAVTLDVEARPAPKEGTAVSADATETRTSTPITVKPKSAYPGGALTRVRRPVVGGLAVPKPTPSRVAMTPTVKSKKTYPAALTVGSSKALGSDAFAAALVELPVDNVFPASISPAYLTKSKATYPGALTLGGAAMGRSGYAAAMVQLPMDNKFSAQYAITPAAKSKKTYPAALTVGSKALGTAAFASALVEVPVDNFFSAQYAITPAAKSKKTYPGALTVGSRNVFGPSASLVEWPVDNIFPAQYAMTPAARSKKTFPGALTMGSKGLGTSAFAAALVEWPVDRSFDAQYSPTPAAKSKALPEKNPSVVAEAFVEMPVDYTLDDFVPLESTLMSRETYLSSLASAGAEKALKAMV